MMIEKKIHYVWVGNAPKPKIFYKCYESWKKYLSDYEIIEINESREITIVINLEKITLKF